MAIPPPAVGARSTSVDRRGLWALGALVVAHLALHAVFFQPAASSPDANGYLLQTRLLAEGGKTWIEPHSSLQLLSEIWLDTGSGRHYCHYPPGLPLLLVPAYLLGGATGALLLHMVLGSLTLVGLYLLCRRWTSTPWALFAVALLAANPTLNIASMTADSHMPATCFLVWGCYALARWESSRNPGIAVVAGLLLGFIPTIRYLEGLLLIGGGLFVLVHLARSRSWSLSAAGFLGGAALPLVWIIVRNTLVYGELGVTGYTFVADYQAFGWENFRVNAPALLSNLQRGGLGPLFWVGTVGVVAMCIHPDTRKRGLLLLASIVPLTAAYTLCFFPQLRLDDYGVQTPGQSPFRYVLPTFPMYILASAWVLSHLHGRKPGIAWGVAAVLGIATAVVAVPRSIRDLATLEQDNQVLADMHRVLDEDVPRGATVIVHRRYGKHLAFAGPWLLADESLLLLATRCDRGMLEAELEGNPLKPYWAGAGEQDFKSFFKLPPPQKNDRLRQGITDLGADWDDVYWVGTTRDLGCFVRQLQPPDTFLSVAEFDLPGSGAATIRPKDAVAARPQWALVRWSRDP